ncbi:hypothetical protein RHGRI_009074 [Rhododendron griersonianum]|uniref:Protein kinase domain-containing protein n=1 Tax=Rhododendron griersonianum TaxID=479676 RepID=A0AAV6L3R2_9ERIC|nr:hypothetical protein RHGRI_009074 [Rhododendron griersonianum]
MKDPALSRRRKPTTPKKLKLVCSFNGAFHRRPPPSENSGETRIITVDRTIGFSKLKSKLSDLPLVQNPNNGLSLCFSLKHLQLPCKDYVAPLVPIESDDDVSCMFGEYEKLEFLGKPARIWIYVCNNGNGFGHRIGKSGSFENMRNGSGLFLESDYHVFGVDSVSGYGSDQFDCNNEVKKSVTGVSDDFWTKVVLMESGRIRGFDRGLGLGFDQNEVKLTCEKQNHSQICLPQGSVSHEAREFKSGGSPYRSNVLEYGFWNTHFQRSENLGENCVPESHSHPLNPRDGNPCVEPNGFMQCSANRCGPISNNGGYSQFVTRCQKHSCDSKMDLMDSQRVLDGGNITPLSANYDMVNICFPPVSCRNQLIGSERIWARLHGGTRNHQVPPADFRSYRSSSYYLRNHRNSVTEMGNHQNLRWEGRPWVRKFYPGLRSSSSISKQGQAMRLFYPSLWKPWSGYQLHTLDSGLNDQTYSFDQPCTNKENFTTKSGHGVQQLQQRNPKPLQFAHNGVSTGRDGKSLLPPIVTNNLFTSTRAMDPQEDLLTGSIGEKHVVPCQNFTRVPSSQSSCIDFEKESEMVEPMVTIDICGSPNTLSFGNGTESGFESELSNIESMVNPFSKHCNGDHVMPGGLASVVDVSLRNLSLSSSKEFEPTACTSPSSNDVSEALVKPHSKHVDLMVEELLTSRPQVDSNGVSLDSFLNNSAKLEKVDEQEEKMQQDHPSNLSVDKQADIGEYRNCSKGNGSIPGDLLQTIKNSDLEYIKELGSGTYGFVFHGKWKGCDVAIKKFKPSCFAEGAPDQDRLVADFWKEAHILGQLHHPHVMVLYGVVTDGPVTNLAAVTEYMVNGSLRQVLRRKDRTIDRRKRLIIAMDAAFGMEYLHEKNVVHFDLKSHNLLVNMRDPQRPVCKIGDFGLSKVKQRTLVSGGVRGTIPWMAPELLNFQKNMVTDKVDVYSFGIIMWELLTGEQPYGNMRSEEIIAGIIKGDLRPEIPSWSDPAWRSLMERCWSPDPDSRPAFSEIAKELRAMSAAMNIK